IHKSLGPACTLVQADRLTVWLDLEQVEIDIYPVSDQGNANDQLLEGMDVRDPEFEEWLTLERQTWQTRLPRDREEVEIQYQDTRFPPGHFDEPPALRQAPIARPDVMTHHANGIGMPFGSGPLKPLLMRLQPPQVIGIGDRGRIVALQLQTLLT